MSDQATASASATVRAAWLGAALKLFGRSAEQPDALAIAAGCAQLTWGECQALQHYEPSADDRALLAACLQVEL